MIISVKDLFEWNIWNILLQHSGASSRSKSQYFSEGLTSPWKELWPGNYNVFQMWFLGYQPLFLALENHPLSSLLLHQNCLCSGTPCKRRNINLFSKAQQPQVITLFCPLAEHRSWWLLSAVAGLQSWSAVSRFSAPILPRQGFEGNHSEDHQNLSVSSFPWCHREGVVSLLATKTQCRKIQEASQGSEPRCQVQPSDVHCRMCHSATSWSTRPFCTVCRASWPCCCPWTPWPASPSSSPPERLSPSSPSSPPLAATAGGHLPAPALRSTWQ